MNILWVLIYGNVTVSNIYRGGFQIKAFYQIDAPPLIYPREYIIFTYAMKKEIIWDKACQQKKGGR
jgi:hypothetical protein